MNLISKILPTHAALTKEIEQVASSDRRSVACNAMPRRQKRSKLKLHPILAYKVGPLSKLMREANSDSDPASFWWLHDDNASSRNWSDLVSRVTERRLRADGAIIIIKGGAESFAAYELLCRAGLITAGKPICP